MSGDPYLTADLPGTGGVMRERLEDFVVEEIPLYEASGVGEHLYVTFQKAGISTHEALHRIATAGMIRGREERRLAERHTAELAIKTLARQIEGEESIHSCLIPEF